MRHPWYSNPKNYEEWKLVALKWNTEYIMKKYKAIRKTARNN